MRRIFTLLAVILLSGCTPLTHSGKHVHGFPMRVLHPDDTTIHGTVYWFQEHGANDGSKDTIFGNGKHYWRVHQPDIFVPDTIINGKHYTRDTIGGRYFHPGVLIEYSTQALK